MPRTFVGGFLLSLGAAILTIAAAGTNAAGLSFFGSVNDFFGVTSMRMSNDSFTPTSSGADQPILFLTNRDGNTEIYKMSVDGSNQQRLTTSTENESGTLWSPDGQKILFGRNINSANNQIWLMNADGSGQTLVSDAAGYNSQFAWSPNGQKILFTIGAPDVNGKIWVMNADGSNKIQLTNTTMVDNAPVWSPDGSKIAFARCDTSFICDVFTMNADGSDLVNLTAANVNDDKSPAWTPDGTKIVFGAQTTTSDRNLFIMTRTAPTGSRLQMPFRRSYTFQVTFRPTAARLPCDRFRAGLPRRK